MLGNETGILVRGLVAAFGLTGLLAASEAAYAALRVVGGVLLVGFGVQALRQARRAEGVSAGAALEGAGKSGGAACRAGLLMNLANPKAAVFAMSFLPQFVPAGAPHLPAMISLAVLWAVYEVGYYGLYVWFVGRMRTALSRAGVRRRLEQVSGGVLVLLGARLALEG